MERNNNNSNNLSNNPNPRDFINLLGGKILRENCNNKGIKKNPWEYCCGSSKNPNFNGEDYYMGHHGCSLWSPRSYICSFCKREFRSAQALGGHMNVHRRDRARLRLNESPSREINLNLNPNPSPIPNPNPNFLTTPPLSRKLQHPPHTATNSLSSCVSTSPNFFDVKKPYGALNESLSPKGADLIRMKAMKSLFGVKELEGLTQENEARVWFKKGDFVGLELGIGLHSEFKEDHVDLELRLGFS